MFKKHVLTRKTTFRLKTQIEAYVLYWVQAYSAKSPCAFLSWGAGIWGPFVLIMAWQSLISVLGVL